MNGIAHYPDGRIYIAHVTPELRDASAALHAAIGLHPDLKRRCIHAGFVGIVDEIRALIAIGWQGGSLTEADLERVVLHLEAAAAPQREAWLRRRRAPPPEAAAAPAAAEPAAARPPEPEPDQITFALHPDGGTLAKQAWPNMGLVIDPPFLTEYVFAVEPVAGLRDLLRVLQEGAAAGAFALRARPLARRGRRALADDPDKGPAALEAAPRRHAALDWEGFDLPGVDPLDGAAAAAALRSLMPPEMAAASLVWQVSASAGIKRGIRLRTWHWLDRALGTDALKKWLAPLHAGEDPVLDPCTLESIQPIFLAVVEGRQVERWGILDGPAGDVVAVPAIHMPQPRRAPPPAPGGHRRASGPHMRKLITDCLRQIDAARGHEGQRLAAFKHWGARALRLAEIAGIDRADVENLLLAAGERLYDGDSERYCRNIEPLVEWWRKQDGKG
jgi:hypothetical protein